MAVDDEPDILRIVEMSLAKWGYAVDSFTDPVEALDRFCRNPQLYSLILTDIKMPGMSGSELAKRARKARPDIKVVVMTAFEVDKDLEKALPPIEQNGFLQKPFHTADVCVTVRRHLTHA
ncbi:MAG: response regulator [Thermoproteota archaeon]